MSKWIVLSKVHPDLSARILMEAGINVIEASTKKPEGRSEYPILVDDGGDQHELEYVLEENLRYFEAYTGPEVWEGILNGTVRAK